MPRKRYAVLVLAATLAVAACSSGRGTTGSSLVRRIIPPPTGYKVSLSAGATGQISPSVFRQYGGAGSVPKSSYVAGFRQNYVNSQTEEGLTVTLLQFSSSQAAAAYLKETAHNTLTYAAPTYKAFPLINGAVEVDGTRPFQGEYVHGVLMARNQYYASIVYVATGPGPAPIEFGQWSRVQFVLLK